MPTTITVRGNVITQKENLGMCEVTFDGERIASLTSTGPYDSSQPLIVPGFIDLHNHGGNRGAFPTGDEEACRRAARFHRLAGTTTLYASTVSGSTDELVRQVQVLSPLVREGLIDGIHLEGPFVNPCKCGAQNPDRIAPGDPDAFAKILDAAGGTVRSMTFAPETDHADELIAMCADNNVIVSLGHTNASYEDTRASIAQALDHGAVVTATHLFNAMPPVHHRAPGAAGALIEAAANGECFVELVGDNVHLHPGTVDMVWRAAPDSCFAVTDSMEAAGVPDGDYILGALDVVVVDGVARLKTADGSPGALAGGTSTLGRQFGIFARRHPDDLAAAVRFTSGTAARVMGKSHEIGDIAVGMRADVVVLDTNLQVSEVYRRGVLQT